MKIEEIASRLDQGQERFRSIEESMAASAVAEISGLSSGDLASADFRCAVVVNGTTYNVTAPLDYSMF